MCCARACSAGTDTWARHQRSLKRRSSMPTGGPILPTPSACCAGLCATSACSIIPPPSACKWASDAISTIQARSSSGRARFICRFTCIAIPAIAAQVACGSLRLPQGTPERSILISLPANRDRAEACGTARAHPDTRMRPRLCRPEAADSARPSASPAPVWSRAGRC